MIIYVDIDDTICYYTGEKTSTNYDQALPIRSNIDKVNQMYD